MNDLWLGIAPAHRLPLAAALCAPLLLWLLRRALARQAALLGQPVVVRLQTTWRSTDASGRWMVYLLTPAIAFHALTGPVALAGALLATRATARRATVPAVLLLLGAYAVQCVQSPEALDQAGMAVALLELAALALAAPRTVTVAVTVLCGVAAWIGGLAAHRHDGVDRLQAGTIRRGPPPAAAPVDGATLAERTRIATERWRDPAAARRDGFAPAGRPEGLQVHFDSKRNQADGRTLDPDAPEQLVYAIRDGRALLLGVVFQMPRAGERGPALPGSAAAWHAHDVCVGVLPPGFGIVSPYGGCPGLTIAVTAAEMIHVWVVDPPGGPYAEDLPEKWVAARLYGSG